MKLLGILLLFCALAGADTIRSVWALQQPTGFAPTFQNANSNVLLGQGIPLLGPSFGVRTLMFANYLAPLDGREDVTLTIGGIIYTTGSLVNFSGCERDCLTIDSIILPRGFYHPHPATLTVSFQGESRSFDFAFAEPIPEPSTFLLLATGLGMGLLRLRGKHV